MILRWAIFFSCCWSPLLAAATVTGSVSLTGSTHAEVRRHKDYSGVVVWLEPEPATRAAGALRVRQTARMLQKNKHFVPHVLAIQVGTDVEFPNLDPIFHNAFSNFSGQIFDIGLYPPGRSRTVSFNRSGIVRVFCNIHPTMSAVIVVLRDPWFAVTERSGDFTLSGVPPGEYRLRAFHERATEGELRSLERRVSVPAEGVELPPIAISETGYVEAPHKNKYGKEYPPVPDDRPGYSGSSR